MALTVRDAAGRPVAAQHDIAESVALVAVFDALLRRGGLGTVLPPTLARIYAAAKEVSGSGLSAPDMSESGHRGTDSESGHDMVGSKEVAAIRGLSDRQARRWCAGNGGTKVGDRWLIRRDIVERQL